jgi:hypothetical protein
MIPWPVLSLLLVLLAEPSGDPPDNGLPSSSERRLLFAKQAADRYRFRLTEPASSKVILQTQPLLRWDNKVVREDDGMLFLWTVGNKGKPVAAAQFFLVDANWHHEFQSMMAASFEARDSRGDWSWGPTQMGVRWQSADDAAVSDSAVSRLRHMKSLAGRFTAAVDQNPGFDGPEQLRLLTTPLYRYASADDGIVDGAMFAFVQGTNPEILILVEATRDAPAHEAWRYAFARMSCFYLRVYRDGKIVWSVEREPVPTPDQTSPYYLRWLAESDRSAELVAPGDRATARP